jgi:diguanylate cyclase (GGDEF)-like protein
MPDSKKIERIFNESKRIFLAETKEKLNDTIFILLKMRDNNSLRLKNDIKRFFHSVNGSAKTFGFEEMSKISSELETMIENTKSLNEVTHKFYSKILEGFSQIFVDIDNEYKKINENLVDVGTGELEENIIDSLNLKNDYIFSLEGNQLLVVDDDISILNIIDKYLLENGYDVIVTSKPEDIFEIIEEKRIDLIVMDINMPEFNGVEVFQKLNEFKVNIPIMFMSSIERSDIIKKMFDMGAEEYIIKPFEMQEFRARIDRILKNRKKLKEMIYKDYLTCAFTERLFAENFDVAKNNFVKKMERFTIAILDLDNFKLINKEMGFDIGNYVLSYFCSFLKKNLTPSDQIYRMYADRFLILFPNANEKDAFYSLEIIRKKVRNLKFKKPELFNKTVRFSAGIISYESVNTSVYELIFGAEESLLKAKEANGNKVFINKSKNKTNGFNKDNKKGNILIIEDSRNIVNLIKNRFEDLEFNVSFSNEGSTGLLMCQAQKPDILILDLMLPGMDGFEISRALKANKGTRDIKIIVITSYSSKDIVVKCMGLRIDAFVIKPIQLSELEMRVDKLLGSI